VNSSAPRAASVAPQSRAVSVNSSAPSTQSAPVRAPAPKSLSEAMLAKAPSDRPQATVRHYSIATSEGSQERPKKVAIRGRQPRVVVLPIAA